MPLNSVSVEHMRVFLAVLAEGSFSKAALREGFDRTTVGRRIADLEAELGITLFVRDGREQRRLTSDGRQVSDRIRQMVENADRLSDFAHGLVAGEQGMLSIGCYPVHIERFLARVLGEFRSIHPEVRIDLSRVNDDRREDVRWSLFDDLREGVIDVVMGRITEDAGFEHRPVYDATVVCVLPDDDPARHRKHLDIEALEGEPILIAPRQFWTRECFERACQAAEIRASVQVESGSTAALAALARVGLGIALCPDDHTAVDQTSNEYPTLVDKQGSPVHTPVALHWRKGEPASAALQAFLELANARAPAP